MRKIFIFLASVYFAIILIASVAIFVVLGTFLESFTESHRFAAFFTYSNPFFVVLLWGFFINILLSALRRWPFKPRHVPFLITHLGLLLILAGTLMKSYWGLQGSLSLLEGSGSDEISLEDTYAIRVDKREDMSTTYLPLTRNFFGQFKLEHSDFNLVAYAPHSVERMETWFKGSSGHLKGIKPFSIEDWAKKVTDFSPSARVRFLSDSQPWNIFAGKTLDVPDVAKQIYLQNLQVKLTDPVTNKNLYHGPIKSEIEWEGGSASITVNFSFSIFEGFNDPHIVVGNAVISLLNLKESNASFSLDLIQTPALVFLQDMQEDVYVFAFDPYGRTFVKTFRNDNLDSYISYDQGFGSYAVQAEIPFANSLSRKEIEEKQLDILKNELNQVADSELPLPLQLLRKASQKAKTDFGSCCLEFFQEWRNAKNWLYPIDQSSTILASVQQLNWDALSSQEKKACYWTHLLFKELEPKLNKGESIISILTEKKWPLLHQLQILLPSKPETALTQQIMMIADQLPDPPIGQKFTPRLFSALCRVYGTYPENIQMPDIDIKDSFTIECPLTVRLKEEFPQVKLEDNLPKITLKVNKKEFVDLAFDRFGKGLKWPILEGEYVLRFQPQVIKLPYYIRLRHARQVNYPHSMQPYSFESDLIITDKRSEDIVEATISMNNVLETDEGYRFYLANISPPNETAAKRVHIVVNYDPAKYWVTYPGAIILSIGIVLLFWFRKKS